MVRFLEFYLIGDFSVNEHFNMMFAVVYIVSQRDGATLSVIARYIFILGVDCDLGHLGVSVVGFCHCGAVTRSLGCSLILLQFLRAEISMFYRVARYGFCAVGRDYFVA